MKKLLIIIAVVLFTVGFADKVSAQNSVTKSNAAGGEILSPITLTAVDPLEFGRLVVVPGGGTVRLSYDAVEGTVVAASSGVTPIGPTAPSVASFEVGGSAGYSYNISDVPASITITNEALIGGTMDITEISCPVSGTLNGSGIDIFRLGGLLTIGSGQNAGRYVGTFNVTVNY